MLQKLIKFLEEYYAEFAHAEGWSGDDEQIPHDNSWQRLRAAGEKDPLPLFFAVLRDKIFSCQACTQAELSRFLSTVSAYDYHEHFPS